MAVAFVRSVGTPVTATGTTVVLTMGATATTVGNVLAVFVGVTTAFAPTGVTDSAGNTYTLAKAQTANTQSGSIWVSNTTVQVPATTGTITATFAASRTASMAVCEYSGSDGTIDVTNGASAAATDVPPTGAGVTTTWNGSCVLKMTGTTVSSTLDVQPSANYTAAASKVSSVPSFYAEHSIVVGVAARNQGNAQWGSASGNVATVQAAIKVTNAAQPPRRPSRIVPQAVPAGVGRMM